ncbi:MAG: glycosyltransferase family 2 protein [Candidatus Limiplasma sp.]|nr:glycosyltransferase family 2 protein [Candidatus Limiplasma sp.]
MSKVLSIAIAAYQAATTIRQTLDSLMDVQTLEALDVIVVDDGSKDETAEIALEYVRRCPGSFRLCQKKNGGWGSTVNKGIELAQGAYFFQLDSDDYLKNVDELLSYLSQCDTDLVCAPHCVFRDSNGEVCKTWTDPTHSAVGVPIPLGEMSFIPSIHNLVFKMDMLKQNPIDVTEHCFYTDVEFILKAFNFAQTISFFAKPVYFYRLAYSGQSMSKDGIRKHYRDHLRITEMLLDYLRDHVTDAHIRELFTARMVEMSYYSYLFFFALPGTAMQKRELIAYDAMLKSKAPAIYDLTEGRLLTLLRKTRFNGYWLVAHCKTAFDRLHRVNIYQAD